MQAVVHGFQDENPKRLVVHVFEGVRGGASVIDTWWESMFVIDYKAV